MSLTIFYTQNSKETLLSVFNFIENKFGSRNDKGFIGILIFTLKELLKPPHILITRNGEMQNLEGNIQLAPFYTKYRLHEMCHFFLPMSNFFYNVFDNSPKMCLCHF